ncbi:Histidine kinase [Propionibacterium ruminifibrarum]|uniref:histidine kinase n=1 Tax=Propionibacterium ruminifibrarum TaxID=1962131 RepID=A0A375I2T0_9ACTN|nr:histidine kinase [Propionibacterium ruminifibrarum]SPF69145.1 Histidine kinase [Propionibacterium ruminifibrarum]
MVMTRACHADPAARHVALATMLAGALTALAVVGGSTGQILACGGAALLGVICALALPAHPLLALTVCHATCLTMAFVQHNPFATQALIYLPVAYWAGRRAPARVAWGVAGLFTATTVLVFVLTLRGSDSTSVGVRAVMGLGSGTLFIAAPLLAGAWLRVADERASGAQALLRAERAEREARIAKALETERGLMAGELHDVASHHMTAVLLDARLARRKLAEDPERAGELLDELTREATVASENLHEVVGILRAGALAAVTPQPTLTDLPELLHTARTINPDISLDIPAVPDVSPAVGLALYRVIQESLTNAHRHAPGARIDVRLTEADGWVSLSITNTRATRPAPGLGGSGLGVEGMRMRCELLGGQLTAGPNQDGWQVLARLPQRSGQDGHRPGGT